MLKNNLNLLQEFLLKANQAGYVTGNEKSWTKEKDGSTTIAYASGDFKVNDNFFGGEPYGGRLIVFFKNKPFWIMVYYGWIKKGISPDTIYPFLRKALAQMPPTAPYRGPKNLKDQNFEYKNTSQGEINQYFGEEIILQNSKEGYRAYYRGGLVDQQQGV